MNIFSRKIFTQKFLVLFLGLVTSMALSGQRPVVTHNIGTGSLNITPAQFGNDYIITGTTTTNTVTVQTNYQGTITLQNLTMTYTGGQSCITIYGLYDQSNLAPVTKVNIVLDGENNIQFKGSNYCAIQVDQGAQIHISAIDPNDNTSGTLFANASSYVKGTSFILDPPSPYSWSTSTYAGAGIGAPDSDVAQGVTTMLCDLSKPPGRTVACKNITAGGNIIISSGTIFAHGGHGAGIGGGYRTYYDGIIIITGGDVQSYAQAHGAGIGSGCPCGQGVDNCYGPNSAIIVLPPAQIRAAGAANQSPYHFRYDTEFALAGTASLTYINDPNKHLMTIRTVDNEPDATIYLDLTLTTGLVSMFTTLGIDHDLAKVKVGKTNASGVMTLHGQLEQTTTFFTDASSSQLATLGRPYMPVDTIVMAPTTIVLPLLQTNISFTDYPSTPLEEGYTTAQAKQNAPHMKVEYNDAFPMTGVTFALQGAGLSDLKTPIFLAADSFTVISAPTTLTNGDVFYIILPVKDAKLRGIYSDVLLINGNWKSIPLPGYIRRIGEQRVVFNDTETNSYIKVTASPNKFTVAYQTDTAVILNLNISHLGLTLPYDKNDVTAKYLVTTEANYNDALTATPLSGWSNLNVRSIENADTATIVSFNGKAAGTYYIHWYVVSGIVYANSKDVTDPPRLYGGFGVYEINNPTSADMITADSTTVCYGDAVTLSASLTNQGSVLNPVFKWYNAPTGGTLLDTGATFTPSPNLTTTTTYYVSLSGTNHSEGTRKAVKVTVMPLSTPDMLKITVN